MKIKELQDLISFISESGLAEVNIKTQEFEVKVRKNGGTVEKIIETPPRSVVEAAKPAPEPSQPAADPVGTPEEAADNLITVKSPMIGTFYRASGPDTDPFINVGDTIKSGETICIIEAMKLFNEIESELNGKVVKVLVDNATPVEYDQPLFIVDPS